MAISRIELQNEKNFRMAGRRVRSAAISALHPMAHERNGREQRSAIAPKLIFGLLNCKPSNIVVKYSTEGGRFSTRYRGGGGGGNC